MLQINPLDVVTTVLGLAYILFEYKASKWMWVVGFIMQSLGIVLYYQKGLYADCAMEFYYLAMTVYGFWKWQTHPQPLPVREGRNYSHDENAGSKASAPLPRREGQGVSLEVRRVRLFPRRLILPWLAATFALWMLIYWLLVTFTDSTVPLADSFTTALSLLGIWALAHKYLEQWFIWIAVDVVTCGLYAYKELPFKSGLYALYVIIAILGYFRWKKEVKKI